VVSFVELGETEMKQQRRRTVGRAFHMHAPGDLAGTYSSIGAGAAVAGGAAGAQLQNANGVILQLHGVKVGAEVSAAVGGVTITMR
jgi:hypothetical protein